MYQEKSQIQHFLSEETLFLLDFQEKKSYIKVCLFFLTIALKIQPIHVNFSWSVTSNWKDSSSDFVI